MRSILRRPTDNWLGEASDFTGWTDRPQFDGIGPVGAHLERVEFVAAWRGDRKPKERAET